MLWVNRGAWKHSIEAVKTKKIENVTEKAGLEKIMI